MEFIGDDSVIENSEHLITNYSENLGGEVPVRMSGVSQSGRKSGTTEFSS